MYLFFKIKVANVIELKHSREYCAQNFIYETVGTIVSNFLLGIHVNHIYGNQIASSSPIIEDGHHSPYYKDYIMLSSLELYC